MVKMPKEEVSKLIEEHKLEITKVMNKMIYDELDKKSSGDYFIVRKLLE